MGSTHGTSRDPSLTRGLVRELSPKQTGRATASYVVSNAYVKGEPFPKPSKAAGEGAGGKRKRGGDDDDDDEEEEQLADIEVERLRNIERNKEILRQLGLA